jgi:hypothetical protein
MINKYGALKYDDIKVRFTSQSTSVETLPRDKTVLS